MDDEKIIDLFWQRDETAITETDRKYSRYCYNISYSILINREDAEECVNDTYLHTWNAIPPHRPNRLSTFLGKITRNLSLQKYIKSHAQKRGGGQVDAALNELEECIPDQGDVEQWIEDSLIQESINRFLRKLKPEVRMVFVSRYWHLNSIEHISARFGFTESKVKSILFRTRKQLKTHLEEDGICL